MSNNNAASVITSSPVLWTNIDIAGLGIEEHFVLGNPESEPGTGYQVVAFDNERDIRRTVRRLKKTGVDESLIKITHLPIDWGRFALAKESAFIDLMEGLWCDAWEELVKGNPLEVEQLLEMAEDIYTEWKQGHITKLKANLEVNAWIKRTKESEYVLRKNFLDPLIESLERQYKSNGETSTGKSKLLEKKAVVEARLGNRIRWNELKKRPELDGKPMDFDILPLVLAEETGIDYSESQARMIVLRLAEKNSYHPVREYLSSVHETHKDNLISLDNLALTLLGTDSPLHNSYLKKHLIGSVARIFEPGCKFDTALILKGNQGIGKSTFFSALHGKDWFNDTVAQGSDKDEHLRNHAYWCIEWAELENAFDRKTMSHIKAFLSSPSDDFRPPYGRASKEHARMFVVAGTTNKDEFLNDPTGSRRYWVIPVDGNSIPNAQVTELRNQIWASAVAAYKSGEQHWLTEEEARQSEEENKAYMLSDTLELKVRLYLKNALLAGHDYIVTGYCIEEVLNLQGRVPNKSEQMRVTNLIKGEGWSKGFKKLNGVSTRVYLAPKNQGRDQGRVEVVTAEVQSGQSLHKRGHDDTTFFENFSQTSEGECQGKNKIYQTEVVTSLPLVAPTVDKSSLQVDTTCLTRPCEKWNPGDEFTYVGNFHLYESVKGKTMTVRSYNPETGYVYANELDQGFHENNIEPVI